MRWLPALTIDVVAVLVFAAIGRQAHAESVDVVGVARTAWPFLAGLAIGTLVGRAWRGPLTARAAISVWLGSVAVGMVLRVISGAGVQFSFVVVATVVLGVFLVGWRLLARLLRAVAGRRRTAGPDGPDRAGRPARPGDGTHRAGTRTPR